MLPKRPLLAATIESPDDLANLQLPVLVSEKKDGIRGITTGSGAVSRKLKPIPNRFINSSLSELPPGIEGEIVCYDCEGNEAAFEDTESGVMCRDGNPSFKFFMFDWYHGNRFQPYCSRVLDLEKWADPFYGVEVIPQHFCENIKRILYWYNHYVSRGREGIMGRDPTGFYKFDRSTLNEGLLWKYKPWLDDEATVIDIIEEMENQNTKTKDERGYSKRSKHIANLQGKGRMGAVLCRNKRFGEFRLSGFDNATKEAVWIGNRPGKTLRLGVNFRFRGVTKYGKPKHAQFVRWTH